MFWFFRNPPANYKGLIALLLTLFLHSCATHHIQTGKNITQPVVTFDKDSSKIMHQFFLIGDAGNADENQARETLSFLENRLKKADKNSTLVFLGDNIYPKGMPADTTDSSYELAKTKLINQLNITKNFKGKTLVIPGNHDWYNGIKGLEAQEKFVAHFTKDKKSFLPRKGCPLDNLKIGSDIVAVVIDSEWFLEDWKKHPTLNDQCDINSREAFFDELESILNKNQNRTKIIVIHHPLMSNGTHGGQFSLKKQLFPLESNIPLPVIGSVINLLRKTTGASPQDIQNKQYTILTKRIKTLLQGHEDVIVVSGHDHNLQYIDYDNIKQIISGSGSKTEAAKAVYPNDFSFGGNGYAVLTVMENKNVQIAFYSTEKHMEKLIFRQQIITQQSKPAALYPTQFSPEIITSVYEPQSTKKSSLYSLFWGKHYRAVYGLPVRVKVATLDTLMGGFTPIRAGGGHQSKSLRIKRNYDGSEFVMRALKKSASRFLQSVAFKDQFVTKDFENTYAESFLMDFYTTAHPYTPFIVGDLAEAVGIFHSNPQLYYIPKHNALQNYNAMYGDELYMIEERPSDSQLSLKSFGTPESIISTDDVLKNLQKDEKYTVDEQEYIKARLFDMLIGDWDRHYDQWRWGQYTIDNKIVYKPIPRDRDQAFSKYDGAALAIIMNIPALRHMQSFKEKIANVKWFNREPYPLDLTFIKNSTEDDWLKQAKLIQTQLTDEVIVNAFAQLPTEVQDATTDDLQRILKVRRQDLQHYASEYFKVLQKTIVITGTDKKDKFIVSKELPHQIIIQHFRIKKNGDELIMTKNISDVLTKEVWIYGLNDDDTFEVKGNAKSQIIIRLIGGQNHDNYIVENGRKIKIYDFKSKKNTVQTDRKTSVHLSDDYELNNYDYKKPQFNAWTVLPNIGYNPDDGVKIGVAANYVHHGFVQNPFTYKHTLKGNFYFATQGFELLYNAAFPKVLGDWDLEWKARFTSPNFAINYFGYGNETINQDKQLGMDYNRVRIQMLTFEPALLKRGRFGSEVQVKGSFENIEVEHTTARFVNVSPEIDPKVFEYQQFAGAEIKYAFENYDNTSLPTVGMGFEIAAGWKINLQETNRNFTTLQGKFNFNHKIDTQGKLVFATLLKGKKLLNNHFEFYQGAVLGGDYDLRGFRNERFLGKESFFQSSDLRWTIGKIKGSIIPMSYGIITGFDYGRVWLDNEYSNKWHTSYGGGIWINGLNVLTAKITCFKSESDRARIAFGLGFGF